MEKYSVLMSLYVKEKPEYLRLAIDSMLNQTVKPDEIVIVEDGPLNDALYGIDIGDRPSISYWTEMKLWLLDIISWYTPKKLFVFLKRVARKCGMKFFSED